MTSAAIPAISREQIKSTNEGTCLIHGFFTLKCANWAKTMRIAIDIDDMSTKGGNQIPATNKVDNAILAAPTKFRVKSDNSYCLNSKTILSNRNTQT